jgi:transcriptional regulator with XRE-family HTH domain
VGRNSKGMADQTGREREELEERRVLGDRLRMLRIRRQLSLGTVALGTGLSRSFLALLETGASDVSVSRLLRIAEFYGVWLADLVGTAAPAVEIVRADEARVVPVADGGQVHLLSLQAVRMVQPFRVELQPGTQIEGGLSHAGEEFVHCVAGTVELEVVDAIHPLAAGDTASFPGRLPHSYRNVGEVEAVLVGATARYG